MASASFGDSDDDLISNRRRRLNGYDIVYTRRPGKKLKKSCSDNDQDACTTSVAEDPAPAIPSGRETEGSTVTETVDAAAAVPLVARSLETVSAHGPNGVDVGQSSLDAPVKERVGGDRDEDTVDELPEQEQHELRIPSDNGAVEGNGFKEAVDDVRPSSIVVEGNLGENSPLGGTDVEVSRISQKDKLNSELLVGSTQDEGPVDGQGFEEPLAIASFGEMIRFSLGKRSSKAEIEDLSKKLESDLQGVRRILEQFELRELQLASSCGQLSNTKLSTNGNVSEAVNNVEYDHSQPPARPDLVQRRLLLRVHPETGPAVHHEGRPIGLSRVNSDIGVQRNLGPPRAYNRQLSVAVMENNHRLGEFAEKEKRTPKANQLYRNTEFLLGKDRLPPESNKRLKTGSGRKSGGDAEHALRYGFGFDKIRNQLFRNCGSLLRKLMNHKFGWVFNDPVDTKRLGLVDYYDIIKHPMDLGTIKDRLSKNWYKSPVDFAEDVRLVFRNAMTYNPKGQDVHIMAEQLVLIFEEKWAVIEAEYNDYCKYQLYKDGRLPATASRRALDQPYFKPPFPASATGFVQPSSYVYAPISSHVPDASQNRTFDRHDHPLSMSAAADPRTPRSHFGRTPAPKKPKAKDPNKRDMTPDEKQKLSKHLQELPTEKLDAIVQIIKKRSTALSQHDDEIEVDIDSVDPETLWELDRFVSNYKKRLSKNKRKAELALQARNGAGQGPGIASSTPAITGIQRESGAFEKSINPAEGGTGEEAYNESSSSSSSSDSGSSSSDSDSDSSSGDGSDAGDSPRT